MFRNSYVNSLKKLIWLVTAILMVAALLAPPAYADERETSVFDTLRADILMLVPEVYQASFLAKVEAAELLLPPNPCVPPSPCAPPNPCASLNILIALQYENQAVSGTNGYLERDAAVIGADITNLLETILPPDPC
jgi:hypothetical protein